eukprot:m.187044 g.187044  ORF g.187044 m.187044 type:complete len:589 (-) comp17514_c0_seq1:5017-6783(-)
MNHTSALQHLYVHQENDTFYDLRARTQIQSLSTFYFLFSSLGPGGVQLAVVVVVVVGVKVRDLCVARGRRAARAACAKGACTRHSDAAALEDEEGGGEEDDNEDNGDADNDAGVALLAAGVGLGGRRGRRRAGRRKARAGQAGADDKAVCARVLVDRDGDVLQGGGGRVADILDAGRALHAGVARHAAAHVGEEVAVVDGDGVLRRAKAVLRAVGGRLADGGGRAARAAGHLGAAAQAQRVLLAAAVRGVPDARGQRAEVVLGAGQRVCHHAALAEDLLDGAGCGRLPHKVVPARQRRLKQVLGAAQRVARELGVAAGHVDEGAAVVGAAGLAVAEDELELAVLDAGRAGGAEVERVAVAGEDLAQAGVGAGAGVADVGRAAQARVADRDVVLVRLAGRRDGQPVLRRRGQHRQVVEGVGAGVADDAVDGLRAQAGEARGHLDDKVARGHLLGGGAADLLGAGDVAGEDNDDAVGAERRVLQAEQVVAVGQVVVGGRGDEQVGVVGHGQAGGRVARGEAAGRRLRHSLQRAEERKVERAGVVGQADLDLLVDEGRQVKVVAGQAVGNDGRLADNRLLGAGQVRVPGEE